MTPDIRTDIFKQPSGNVRGIVIALRGKDRVAHAYLFTDKPPRITLDKVRNVESANDIFEITAILSGFADEVKRNS